MTLADALGLSDREERLLARGLQLVLLAMVGYGLVAGRIGVAVNGAVALVVTLVPAVLRREYGYSMDAGLVLWITVAAVLHSGGIIGLYKQYSWYDEVTHSVSAAFVAGTGYALLRAVEIHSEEVDVPDAFRPVFVIVFVLAFGVVWEVLEFGIEQVAHALGIKPPLVVYGISDIVYDLVFNAVGAVVVAAWGMDYFTGLAGFVRRRLSAGSEE